MIPSCSRLRRKRKVLKTLKRGKSGVLAHVLPLPFLWHSDCNLNRHVQGFAKDMMRKPGGYHIDRTESVRMKDSTKLPRRG